MTLTDVVNTVRTQESAKADAATRKKVQEKAVSDSETRETAE
jgi:hypothetical protein